MRIGITERGDAAVHAQEVLRKIDQFDGAILITKNPGSLMRQIGKERLLSLPVVVHCTITGMGGSRFEPGVLPKEHTLTDYLEMVELLGNLRTVLRVDPIVPTSQGLQTAMRVLEHTKGRTRVSFMDGYGHAISRIRKISTVAGSRLDEVYADSIHADLDWRRDALHEIEQMLHSEIEVCGEPGLKCTGCVSALDLEAMGLKPNAEGRKGQRSACCCIAAKTEMLSHRGQCSHGCAYCYWK